MRLSRRTSDTGKEQSADHASGSSVKLSHAFLVAIVANIIGAILYDYAKDRVKRQTGAR